MARTELDDKRVASAKADRLTIMIANRAMGEKATREGERGTQINGGFK